MSKVEQMIDVDVPVRSAYDQWTQFEDFPRFMEGVEDVRQLDDRHCHWRTKIAGVQREFDTEIVDQLPDERIAWRSTGDGIRQKGVVSFQPLDAGHTRVRLAMDVEPEGMAEKTADALGMLDRRVKGDLKRFKGFIEDHDQATGGWRGRIRPKDADTARTSTGTPMGEEPGPMDAGTAPMGEGPGPMREEPGSMGDPDRTRRSSGTESWPLPPGPGDPGLR
ncbi:MULTISPECIES: SRPBCC family protein [Streptomyces]|uniref:SRPBCC family protein n=1 Tax=Streptomyces TaxID=1883 RepID=UPI00099DC833|nr:SRPBCC family protein [Streptomyces viridochromogenes]